MRYTILVALVLLASCQSAAPKSEGWQDAPTHAELRHVYVHVYVVPLWSDNVRVDVRILDQGGDIGGGRSGKQEVKAEQEVKVDAEVDTSPLP